MTRPISISIELQDLRVARRRLRVSLHLSLLFAVFLALQSAGVAPADPPPDLRHVISDNAALASVEISYHIDEQLIVMRGDGSVFMQSTSQQLPLLPTCKGKVTPADIHRLLETMLTAQFLNLPLKSYTMLNGDEADWRKLQLHSISIKVAGGARSEIFLLESMAANIRKFPGNSRQ